MMFENELHTQAMVPAKVQADFTLFANVESALEKK